MSSQGVSLSDLEIYLNNNGKRASYLRSLIPIRIYHIKINRSVRHFDEFELFTVG